MRDRRSNWQTAAALAGATLLSAFAAEGNAGAADEAQGVIVHEHRTQPVPRNLSTTLRHRRLRFTEQSLLLWMWQVG